MTNLNFKELYKLVENNALSELEAKLEGADAKAILNFLKWQSDTDNNNTALHIAFEEANAEIIKKITKGLSTAQLSEALNIKNIGGINPVGKILQMDESSQASALQTILSAFSTPEDKKAVLISVADNNETLLHQLIEEYNSDLLDAALEIAHTNGFLLDLLCAKNDQGNSPIHTAFSTKHNEFLTKVLAKAKEAGIIEDILNDKGENDNTIVHLGLESDEVMGNLIMSYALETSGSATLLSAENTGGIKPVNKLFENEKLIDILLNTFDKAAIIDSIVDNILNSDALKNADEEERSSIKEKVTKIYEAIKSDNALKVKLLEVLDLDTTDYSLSDCFPDNMITDKLWFLDISIANIIGESTVNISQPGGLDALNVTLQAFETYKIKFASNLSENFGNKIIAAIKTKLDSVKDGAVALVSSADEAGLQESYSDAKSKIEFFSTIYANKEFKDLKETAETALQDAVKTKAKNLVDSVCKESYEKVAQANECLTKISELNGKFDFLDGIFNSQKEAAEQYIEDNQKLDETNAKSGFNLAFSYAKDQIVLNDIARYLGESDLEVKKGWAVDSRKLMTSLKSGIPGEKAPGIDKISGYNQKYHSDALGKANKLDTFLKNIANPTYKNAIEANAAKSLSNACTELKVEDECTAATMLSAVKSKICPIVEQYSWSDTNANQLLCSDSVTELESLSYNSDILTSLSY